MTGKRSGPPSAKRAEAVDVLLAEVDAWPELTADQRDRLQRALAPGAEEVRRESLGLVAETAA